MLRAAVLSTTPPPSPYEMKCVSAQPQQKVPPSEDGRIQECHACYSSSCKMICCSTGHPVCTVCACKYRVCPACSERLTTKLDNLKIPTNNSYSGQADAFALGYKRVRQTEKAQHVAIALFGETGRKKMTVGEYFRLFDPSFKPRVYVDLKRCHEMRKARPDLCTPVILHWGRKLPAYMQEGPSADHQQVPV